jgi:hypothetical protein
MIRVIMFLIIVSFSVSAATAFLKHSYVSGSNRICVYDHLGSDYTITIKSYKVCPVQISV